MPIQRWDASIVTAEMCTRGDIWIAANCSLFDHLGGDREQRRGDCDAKCLGGLEVDREVKLGRHLYGQIGRLFAPQNAIYIDGG